MCESGFSMGGCVRESRLGWRVTWNSLMASRITLRWAATFTAEWIVS